MDYEKYYSLLFSGEHSLDAIAHLYKVPNKLYKYQTFYTTQLQENPYWYDNLHGAFHMSLAKDFEDHFDCDVKFNLEKIKQRIYDLFKNEPFETIQSLKRELDQNITAKDLKHVALNYKNKIRIGCFTTNSNNRKMWEKYANNSTGYCIEYKTNSEPLSQTCFLPICYMPYKESDLSDIYSKLLILEVYKNAKEKSGTYNSKTFKPYYKKIVNQVYSPIFIKTPEWQFEKEYRMYLTEQKLSRSSILNKQYNLDLSDSINAIYLGTHFEHNPNSSELKQKVEKICSEKRIHLYQKKLINEKLTNQKIF